LLPRILLLLFGLWFAALGISVDDRQTWLLENLLVFAALPILVWSFPRFRFSDGVYVGLFVLFCLHEVGAHYTYSLVPYDAWLRGAFGSDLTSLFGLERNHYDRLVHLLYGLLVTPAMWEVFQHYAPPRGAWRWLLPATAMFGHSTIYELMEFAAAALFGGDVGTAYLGTQGDVWDAQKDMTLACLGSVLALVRIAVRERRRSY
jgi:putative membrane protein